MYNLLRSNYTQAFTTADKAADNAGGGIALWEVPDEMRCAFNPIIVTRTMYLHLIIGSYEPSYSPVPCYIIQSAPRQVAFPYALATSIRVCVHLVDDTYAVATVGSGRTYWDFSVGADIDGIVGVSFDTSLTAADYAKFKDYISDNTYIYVRQGFAYQDSNFMCSISGDVLYKNTAVDTCTFNVYKTDGSYVKLSAESCYGVTKFDVAAVVKSWFNRELQSFPAGVTIVTDKALSIRYKIIVCGVTYTLLAVNAVAQIGEDPNLARLDECVLTKFTRIDYYDGYPLDYSILVSSTGETQYEAGELSPLAVSRVKVDDSEVELWTENDDEVIEDEYGNKIYILPEFDIPVIVHCTPRKPFYVRWINQLGGVDYFMFGRQQKRAPAVKSVSTYEAFVENPLNAKTNNKAYSLTTENNITVGAELLCEADFQALRWIAFSRKIEHYDETLGKWIELAVSKFDGTFNTKNEMHTVEVTFSLPNINIQY